MTLANGYKRVYHYHLKKCGGTSMNAWLASQFADHRVWNPSSTAPFIDFFRIEDLDERIPSVAVAEFGARAHNLFRWSEIVYSHAPFGPYVPPATFSFTVLRSPIDRVISQVADWRRLHPADYSEFPDVVREAIGATRTLSLGGFLAKYAKTLPMPFDNYLVRATAAARLGLGVVGRHDLDSLAETATLALDTDFDLVGITERQQETQAMIANILGFAPEASFVRLNVTNSNILLVEEREEARDILEELTRFDQPLYDRAKQLFERRLASTCVLNEARFERHHAAASTDRLEANELNGNTAFSVRGPIIGAGLHPRDSAGHTTCRVWTGPGTRSVLYMPAPVGVPLNVKLWVHGYAAERQRGQVRIEVDDRLVSHRYETADGWREVIVVDAVPSRPWIKLTMRLDETLTGNMAGQTGADDRRRGISFDYYGWNPASPS